MANSHALQSHPGHFVVSLSKTHLSLLSTEGVDRGAGGTGIEGAESGVESAESGVEGAGGGSRGGGKRGHCGRGSGKIGGRNCFFLRRYLLMHK